MDVPRYSFIAAVNNIGRYLDRFIGSIEAQTLDWSEYEVVAVDDGSTDDSLDRLQRWAAERPGRVTVLSKENGGQSTARNLGIELARGEWLPFTGPDDVLNPTYVVEVDRFLDANPKVPMVATYRVFLDDATGAVRDTHPLRSHFAGKSKLRYLDGWPSHFHGSAPAAFFRGERIIEFGLRVDPDVRPNFEDGNFCVRYLLAEHRPAVGFLKSAVYQYRKRSEASSTLQTSLENPDCYTKVLRNGYRALLRQLLIGRSRPPEWLQNYVIYELSWYFTSQDARASTGGSATGSVAKEFQALMAEICPLLDAHVVKSFRLRRIPLSLRFILLHAYADRPWHSESALIDVLDSRRRLARVRYFFIGENPGGVLTCGGEAVGPAFAKDAPSVTTIGHCFESESCGCPRTPPFASSWTADQFLSSPSRRRRHVTDSRPPCCATRSPTRTTSTRMSC